MRVSRSCDLMAHFAPSGARPQRSRQPGELGPFLREGDGWFLMFQLFAMDFMERCFVAMTVAGFVGIIAVLMWLS